MNCKLCDSPNISKVKWGSTELFFCNECNVHFLPELPIQEKLENYYEKEYKIKNEVGHTEFRRIARLHEQYELIGIINQYRTIGSIIDIGCDKGYFLDEARRMGIKACGVELSEKAREYCKNVGLDVRRSISEFDEKFDAAIMNHSLEHFPSPKEIILEINTKLNDNGLLIIRVPAFDSFWSKIMKNHWIWFQPKNHYFHFSLKSLQDFIMQNGFKIKMIKYRKPNNRITKKFASIARISMMNTTNYSPTLRNIIGSLVESITGVEILLIAEKKAN